jgi:Rod binding domain-containing protein
MTPVLAAASPGGRTMTLHEAAREIEAQFLVEMLKAARQAGEPLAESREMTGAENYQEFAERFLAQELARRETLGLARLLERELSS